MGCGEPRANSGTAEQTELPTARRYVPARPAPHLGPLPERLAGQGAGRWPLVVGAGEKRVVEAREALAFRTLKLGDTPPPPAEEPGLGEHLQTLTFWILVFCVCLLGFF